VENVTEEARAQARTSSIVTSIMSLIMGICILGALFALYMGFREADNAIQQIDFLALSAVLGIFARIAQAAKHHEEASNKH
jgi:hypothetical protein